MWFVFLLTVLVGTAFTRSIPEYELCMDACGEDPHEDDISAVANVAVCRNRCIRDEKNRCLEKHHDKQPEKRKCWEDALFRCIVLCGDEADCLHTCRILYTPPVVP
ncbi:hypothetical protein CSKR_108604 [Clonorchis sinensis]|uniref:Uncharacterized protein n=1 Tax=Clonorchis sinensis TaxID=79923 RepID=A0A8T1M0J9_CLOSI|nr:hypothetical protein CSKR_108604 [Clonorchis sinensis]